MSQNRDVKKAILQKLDNGMTDKQEIYTSIVQELGVPRPTVRRIARDVRNDLLEKVKILQAEPAKLTTI